MIKKHLDEVKNGCDSYPKDNSKWSLVIAIVVWVIICAVVVAFTGNPLLIVPCTIGYFVLLMFCAAFGMF